MRRAALLLFWASIAVSLLFALYAIAPGPLGENDKLLHMAAFALLAVLGSVAYPRRSPVGLFVGLAAFGGLIELAQMIPLFGRDPDWRDWLADCLSAGATLALVWLARRLAR